MSGQRPPFAPVAGHVGQCVKEPEVADKSAAPGLWQQVTNAFELRASDVHAGTGFSVL